MIKNALVRITSGAVVRVAAASLATAVWLAAATPAYAQAPPSAPVLKGIRDKNKTRAERNVVSGKPPGARAPSAAGGAGGEPAAAPSGVVATEVPGEREFNSCKKLPANKRIVKLTMKPDTELGELVGWISSITCRQFIIPGSIPANSKKVTIHSPQLITPEEAYRLFLSAIESVGLTVEPTDKFLRIVESNKARFTSIPVYGYGSRVPSSESFVTRLVRVENVDVNEVANVLTRIKGEQGDIVTYAPQGTLIITDQADNITRMLRILDELDVAGMGEKVWMLRMKNIAASEMALKIAEIFQVAQIGGRKAGAPTPAGNAPAAKLGGQKAAPTDLMAEMVISKIIPDERSNQLIIIANDRAYARILTLVKKLDVPIEGGDGRIHVYYCENANCDELAQTLGAVTGVSVSGGGAARTSRGRTGAAPAPAPGGAPANQPGQVGQISLFEGDVRINFDRPTNSLIILSSLKDYQSLRRVIERLDAARKQVFVEALVLEVALDKTRDLGVSYHGGLKETVADKQGLGLFGFDASKTLQPAGLLTSGSSALLGLSAGFFGPPIAGAAELLGLPPGAVGSIPSFGVFVQALQRNNDVNVLSNPHILITNNDEGEISVGQNLPFPGATPIGAPAGQGGLGALGGFGFSTPVNRQDVALKMKLVPHVNEHNMIRLEVDQEISDILSPNFNGLGPATSKRTVKTTVVARDQQTIVLGGLMSDRTIDRVTKIPLLGDIPILGFFFRNTTKTVQKTNILVALTPYVVTDQSDLRRVLEKKLRERREFVERFGAQGDRLDIEAQIDYRRKRGMLEEINRATREIEEEEAEMIRIRQRDLLDESGPVDLPSGYTPPAGNPGAPAGAPAGTPPAPGAPAPAPAPAPGLTPPTIGPGSPPPALPAPPPPPPVIR